MGVDNIGLLLSVVFGVISAYVYYVFATTEPDYEDQVSVPLARRRRQERGLLFKYLGPVIVVLAQIISLIPMSSSKQKMQKRLIQGGRPGGLSVDEFYATRVIGFVIGGFVGMFFDNELDLFPAVSVLLGFLGLFYPDIWLGGAITKRRRAIFRDLPDALDTLRLAVDAGMDLASAMDVLVDRGKKGPLLDELEMVQREVSLGRTRYQAFRNFADRIQMTEVNSFVVALLQADQLGASVGPILKVQSEVARTRRWQLAEALVNKMPVKMMGPLILFIFPASFIILFTPLIIQYMQAGE